MDANENAAWIEAEMNEDSNKETKRKLKNVKWTTVSIKVPMCPKCRSAMEHELDPHARTLWKWKCPQCTYTI